MSEEELAVPEDIRRREDELNSTSWGFAIFAIGCFYQAVEDDPSDAPEDWKNVFGTLLEYCELRHQEDLAQKSPKDCALSRYAKLALRESGAEAVSIVAVDSAAEGKQPIRISTCGSEDKAQGLQEIVILGFDTIGRTIKENLQVVTH